MSSSIRPYQNQYRKNARMVSGFNRNKDMVKHDVLEGERKENLKRWITFFRRNPVRFIQDYFKIKLHPYQILWIWIMQRSNLAYIVASRGAAKTFIIAIWALTLCVLYPGIKVVTASKTLKQAGLIIKKIEDLRHNYPNVEREIENITTNQNGYVCTFWCGSTIVAVPSSENARGQRANYLVIEEARIVSKEILDTVLKPFLEVRTPPYRLLPEYRNDPTLKEEGIITYITSAGYKAEYWYTNVKTCIKRVCSGDVTANFLAFDHLITLFHSIKTEAMLKNEMSDNDALTVQMEYLNIPAGASGKSFYRLSHFPRVIKKAFYPQRDETFNLKKNPYDIKQEEGELRFLSVDIAARAGRANDQSIISCIKAIPLLGRGYERQLLFQESYKGINMLVQAKRIKEIFYDFSANFLCLDLQNVGPGVYDPMTQSTYSEERGITYPPLTIVGPEYDFIDDKLRKDLEERTLSLGANPVIFPIMASQQSNSQMATMFRSALQRKLWQFLIPEMEGEEWLIKNNKEFVVDASDTGTYGFFTQAYFQTSLTIGECINLDMTIANGLIKLSEKAGNYKDRYSTLLYINWIISQFDKSLLREVSDEDDWSILSGLTQVY